MTKQINAHHNHLQALYDQNLALPDDVADRARFRFDAERRIMDLSRILWKYWPTTSHYMRGRYGDDFILDIARIFSHQSKGADSVEKAVSYALDTWLTNSDEPLMQELVRYERIKIGVFEETSAPSNFLIGQLQERLGEFRVAAFSFNPVAFEKAINFYVGLHAPDTFVSNLFPTYRATYLAVYKRGDRILAADVTSMY